MKKTQETVWAGGVGFENGLQKARLRVGFTQEQAAEILGCTTRALQRYELGERVPSVLMAYKMENCYKCELSELFPRELLEIQEEQE